jgi:hypothetical protein
MQGQVRIKGYVHYCARAGLTRGGVHIGHSSAWGKRLANRRHLILMEGDN